MERVWGRSHYSSLPLCWAGDNRPAGQAATSREAARGFFFFFLFFCLSWEEYDRTGQGGFGCNFQTNTQSQRTTFGHLAERIGVLVVLFRTVYSASNRFRFCFFFLLQQDQAAHAVWRWGGWVA
jgi:hypothetical protein